MPRYRKFPTHKTQDFDILEMPDDFTRLLWVMLPLGLDREGRGIYDAKWVKAQIMPMRDDVTSQMVRSAIDWYWRRGLITRYKVGNREYFYYTAWVTEQGECTKEAESCLPGHHRAQVMLPADELPLFDNSGASPAQVESRSGTDAQVDAYADAQVDADAQAGADAPLTISPPDTPPIEEKKQRGKKLPRERDALFDAICEVCRVDPATAGASVGNVKKALLGASPPYSPDEVRRFGEWHNSDEWRRQKGPPSLWGLKEKIGIVRENGGSENDNASSRNSSRSYSQDDIAAAAEITRRNRERMATGTAVPAV